MNLLCIVLTALTFVGYSVVLGPTATTLLMIGLLTHALGHTMVAKRYGIASTIRFIPFLGVVETLENEPVTKSAWIAIAAAGPLAGGAFALLTLSLGIFFAQQSMVLSGSILLSINLSNLLPIPPLDGGRIVKALLVRS